MKNRWVHSINFNDAAAAVAASAAAALLPVRAHLYLLRDIDLRMLLYSKQFASTAFLQMLEAGTVRARVDAHNRIGP